MDFFTYHSAPSPAWGMYTVTMVTESLVWALRATVEGGKMERENMQHLTQKTTAFSIGIFFSFFLSFYQSLTNTIQAVLKGIQWKTVNVNGDNFFFVTKFKDFNPVWRTELGIWPSRKSVF